MKPGEKWKIIFLDIDGVLCLGKDHYRGMNPTALANLRFIIESTGAKIVVSSSWREGDVEKTKLHFPEWFREHIIGETVHYYSYVKNGFQVCRGNEIYTWVHDHLFYPWYAYPEIDELYRTYREDGSFECMNSNRSNVDFTYVILDDDIDMLYIQRNNFVITDTVDGLTKTKANKCIKILNKI